MPSTARSSTGSRAIGPQAEALDAALAGRSSRVDLAIHVDVPLDELVRRLSGRWICRDAGHVYHEQSNPPRVAGQCDLDGSPLIQRDDDRPDTIRARLTGQLDSLAQVVDHYRETGVLRTIDGLQSIDAVTADPDRRRWPSSRRGRPDRGHPQVARRDRAHAQGRPDRRRGPRPDRRRARARRLDGAPRRAGRGAHPPVRRDPVVQGLSGRQPAPSVPRQRVHLHRPGDRPRHPRRADASRTGQIVSVDAGAILDGWHGDARPDVLRRRPAAGRSAT